MNSKLSTIVLGGLSWSFGSRVVSNLAQLLIYFILARVLEPVEFGIMASLTVFINLSNMFATAGLGNANIQMKETDEKRYSTIFYLCLGLSIFLYLIIFLSAPALSNVLNITDNFDSLLQIYGLTISLTVISSMQISQLSRALEFKKIFYCSTIPSIFAGVVSIFLAYRGFGIYALIANVGIARILSILLYSLYYPMFPKLGFNIDIAKASSMYSGNLFTASLLDELYRSSMVILIGKFYNATLLGYYNVGRQIPGFISNTLNATVASVIFPVFSGLQDDLKRGKEMLRKSLRTLNITIFPVLSLMIILTDEIIIFLLTDKWLPIAPYLKLFTIILGLHHIYMSSTAYINSLGESFVTLKYNILNKLFAVLILLLTYEKGVEAIVFGQLIVIIFLHLFNMIPSKIYIRYSYKEQIEDFAPAFLTNLFLFIIFSNLKLDINSLFLTIVFVTSLYLILYSIIIFIMHFQVLDDWRQLIK